MRGTAPCLAITNAAESLHLLRRPFGTNDDGRTCRLETLTVLDNRPASPTFGDAAVYALYRCCSVSSPTLVWCWSRAVCHMRSTQIGMLCCITLAPERMHPDTGSAFCGVGPGTPMGRGKPSHGARGNAQIRRRLRLARFALDLQYLS